VSSRGRRACRSRRRRHGDPRAGGRGPLRVGPGGPGTQVTTITPRAFKPVPSQPCSLPVTRSNLHASTGPGTPGCHSASEPQPWPGRALQPAGPAGLRAGANKHSILTGRKNKPAHRLESRAIQVQPKPRPWLFGPRGFGPRRHHFVPGLLELDLSHRGPCRNNVKRTPAEGVSWLRAMH
jgi:hypothetical protein